MFDNLYTFKKSSNHVKLFKWFWGVDPTEKFKSMCPYFWAYIGTIILSPILILLKLLGPFGEKISNKLYHFKKDLRNKKILKLNEKMRTIIRNNNLCGAYKLYKYFQTKNNGYTTYKNIYWYIDSELKYSIKDLKTEYQTYLYNKLLERKKNNKEYISNIKEDFILSKLILLILIIIGCFLLYFTGLGVYILFDWIHWVKVFKFLLFCIKIILSIGIVIGIIIGVIKLWEKLDINIPCNNIFRRFFNNIGRGIVLFCDIIYNMYKKNCPLITWEENDD